MKLLFRWENEEDCSVYLDGRYIILMSHGPHGWDGMRGIEMALLRLADRLGWEVEVEGDPAI